MVARLLKFELAGSPHRGPSGILPTGFSWPSWRPTRLGLAPLR